MIRSTIGRTIKPFRKSVQAWEVVASNRIGEVRVEVAACTDYLDS